MPVLGRERNSARGQGVDPRVDGFAVGVAERALGTVFPVGANLNPARGRLVVATPDLEDPNFEGTVVLLLEHDDDGTLGVVLNRPSELPVGEAMSGPPDGLLGSWDTVVDDPPVIFVGGPVRPNAVIALARVPSVADAERWQEVVGELGVISLGDGPLSDVGAIADLRVFAGYAGWGPTQLDAEIEGGSWFVVESRPADPFTAEPEGLWHDVLRRQGGVFTTVTPNPALN